MRQRTRERCSSDEYRDQGYCSWRICKIPGRKSASVKNEYKEICDRSLSSADACFGVKTHEHSAFLGYHAYESLGGAYCSAKSATVPKAHPAKLNAFAATLKGHGEAHTVAQLNVQLASLRNLLLYPSLDAQGSLQAPKDVLTESQARNLVNKIRGLRRKLDRYL